MTHRPKRYIEFTSYHDRICGLNTSPSNQKLKGHSKESTDAVSYI